MQLLLAASLSCVVTVIFQAIVLYVQLGCFSLMHLTLQLFVLSSSLSQFYKVLLQFFADCLSPYCPD